MISFLGRSTEKKVRKDNIGVCTFGLMRKEIGDEIFDWPKDFPEDNEDITKINRNIFILHKKIKRTKDPSNHERKKSYFKLEGNRKIKMKRRMTNKDSNFLKNQENST